MTTGFALLARDLLDRAGTSSFTAELGCGLEMEGVAHELELLGCHVARNAMRCLLTVGGDRRGLVLESGNPIAGTTESDDFKERQYAIKNFEP
jgi:hypothetical protein